MSSLVDIRHSITRNNAKQELSFASWAIPDRRPAGAAFSTPYQPPIFLPLGGGTRRLQAKVK